MDSICGECSAVMLNDWRVLFVGGHNGNNSLSAIKILDMALNTSSLEPQMSSKWAGCAAILLLRGGGVLVIGGRNDNDSICLPTIEVLEVYTNSTSPGPEMNSERYCCEPAKMEDSCLLVLGSLNNYFETLYTSKMLNIPNLKVL